MISVVLPTFNRGYVVARGVEGVRDQNYRDHEVVVVDDGSTDDTEAVIGRVAAENVRYLRHPVNLGVAAARNTGVRASQGELIALLDSDDVWKPEMLERIASFLEAHPDIDAAFCDVEIVDGGDGEPAIPGLARWLPCFSKLLPSERLSEPLVISRRDMYLCLLVEVPVKPSALVVRKSAFERVGYFSEELRSGEDWEWLLRLARTTDFGYIDLPLARQHQLQDATHLVMREADKRGVIELLAREEKTLGNDLEARAAARRGINWAVQDLAWYYRSNGKYWRACRVYFRGFTATRDRTLLARAALAWIPFGLQERRRQRRIAGGMTPRTAREADRQTSSS
jgi:glycosyltransferase involved in cell wall biosynthesis